MVEPWQLAAALLLDLLLGDPRSWPHPAKFAGWLATISERLFRKLRFDGVIGGAGLWFIVVGAVLAGYLGGEFAVSTWNPLVGDIVAVMVIYQCIAARDLWDHVRAVQSPLLRGELKAARNQLAMIVGRDTENLDESEISRATVETTAESFNDGFVAPLLWTLVLGAPGALLFRCANTLDSMVGHRDEDYECFGKFSAHVDDVLAWIPARVSAFLIWPAGLLNLRLLRREARQHLSPNAGWPEAAMAYALNCRLGGANTYDGKKVTCPVIHSFAVQAEPETIGRCLSNYVRACVLLCGIVIWTSFTIG